MSIVWPMAGSGLATIMFTDLVGSTRMRDRLGDDVADEIGVEHDRIIGDALASTGGRLVKNLGDGALAVFDSSVDAVMAGRRIQEGVVVYNREADEVRQIGVRIGINAGEIAHEDGDIIGLPVAVASRVCDKADGGQILITDTVKALIGRRARFPYVTVGSHSLKGVDGPVELWSIEEPRQLETTSAHGDVPFPAFLTRAIPRNLVGRDKQFDLLDAAHIAATAGTRLVTVIGEPGIGKTSLTSTWCRSAADQGTTVVVGRCTPDAALPYQPFIEIAQSIVGARPEILGEIGPAAGNIAQLLPGMSTVNGLPVPIHTDPDTTLYLMAEAFGSLLKPDANSPATVAVLDDLHWADEASIGVLAHLARKDENLPLVIIGTYRDTDLVRSHPLPQLLTDLRRQRRLERLPLPRLTEDEVGAMIDSHFGGDTAAGIVESIAEETQGNPFFIEEITTHLQDEGAIDESGAWVSDIPIEEYGIPEGVRDVVGRRLDRLGPDAVATLEVASVIGPTFSIDVAGEIAGLDERGIDEVIDASINARLIAEDDDADEFAFAHALLRQTLYDELPTRRRVRLHRAVGEALESRDAPAVQQLNHWLNANESGKALQCAIKAATAAENAFSLSDAIGHMNLAYDLWDEVDDAETAAGISRTQLVLRLNETRFDFGIMDTSGFEKVNVELGRSDLDDETRALLLNDLATLHGALGQTIEATKARTEALDVVPKTEPNAAHALILSGMASKLAVNAQSEAAIEVAAEALEIARHVNDDRPELAALTTLGTASLNLGRLEEADEYFNELAKRASETGILRAQLIGYVNQASGLAQHGHIEDALKISMEGIDRTSELGVLRWEAMLRGNAGDMLFDLGRWDEAEAILSEAEFNPAIDYPQINVAMARMQLAAERGDADSMQSELENLGKFTVSELDTQFQGPYRDAVVSDLRWRGDASAAHEAGIELLDAITGYDDLLDAPRLTAFVTEAVADAVVEGTAEDSWIDDSHRWVAKHAEFKDRLPFGTGFAATATADLARAEGNNSGELWRAAVGAWDNQVYYRAKAQWRLAQSLIETDPTDPEAIELLDAAQDVAEGLKAQPLLDAIGATREKAAQ